MSCYLRNLVFEGGSVKERVYMGALEILEARGIISGICRVGGASAGAIVAVVVGLSYSSKELDPILHNLNFHKFTDKSFGLIRNTCRLLSRYDWYKRITFVRGYAF